MRFAVVQAALLLVFSIPANATDVSSCDAALVKDTDYSFSKLSYDYRLATLVSQKDWNEKSTGASADAVIYEIPIGLSYADYQNSVRQVLTSRNESISLDETRQLAIEKLSNNGRDTYLSCLKSLHSSVGIALYVSKITKNTMTLKLEYNAGPGYVHLPLLLSWSGGHVLQNTKYPKLIGPGATKMITLVRPKSDSETITVTGGAFSDAVDIYAPASPPTTSPSLTLFIDSVDDIFKATLDENPPVTFQASFNAPGHWDLSQYLRRGLNVLSLQVIDAHDDGNGHPCWGYHYRIVQNMPDGTAKTYRENSQSTCGVGSQPPPATLPPERIIF